MRSILLVMDMINDLVHADGPNAKVYGPALARRAVIANNAVAIDKARKAGVPVGYVRVGFSADYREVSPRSPIFTGAQKAGLFKLGTWGTEVHPELSPRPEDEDIVKHRVSPFYATRLEAVLRARGIERLYLTGVATGGVVLSGAKEGHDRDYEIVLLDDCIAAPDDEQHRHLMNSMARFARITTAAELGFD